MTDAELVLIVEDNARNLKLVRDVLAHTGYRTSRRRPAEDGIALARDAPARTSSHGRPAAGDGRRRGARTAARRAGDRDAAGRRGDRVRHEGRSRAAASRPDSTGTSRSRSSVREFPAQVAALLAGRRQERGAMSATILVVDDLPQNVRLLEAVLAPRGYDVVVRRPPAQEALERVAAEPHRSRPARHRDAGHGRLRGLPAAARRRRHALPARRDDHRQRRAGEASRRSRPAPTTSSPSRSIRPSCSRACARCCGSSAYHDTIERAGGRARGVEPRARAARRRSRSPSWSGSAGCGASSRRSSPSSSCRSGDESFLESHRREITVVFCDLRGFTAFAETAEPEEVMAVLARVPRGAGRPRPSLRGHARAVHRRRPDGLLQRPAAVLRTRRLRAVRMAVAMRDRVARAGRGVAAAGATTCSFGDRHRAGLRDAGSHRLRGPLGLRRDRQRHQPRRAAVRAAEPGQILVSQRVHAAVEDVVVRRAGRRARRCAASPGRRAPTTSRGLDAARSAA